MDTTNLHERKSEDDEYQFIISDRVLVFAGPNYQLLCFTVFYGPSILVEILAHTSTICLEAYLCLRQHCYELRQSTTACIMSDFINIENVSVVYLIKKHDLAEHLPLTTEVISYFMNMKIDTLLTLIIYVYWVRGLGCSKLVTR